MTFDGNSSMNTFFFRLPLPWLAYSMSKSFKDVVVQNSGLFCSTILLFLMLVAVVVTIALSKWKMTKMLGGIMFGLYVVFITLTLLLQLDVFACPFGWALMVKRKTTQCYFRSAEIIERASLYLVFALESTTDSSTGHRPLNTKKIEWLLKELELNWYRGYGKWIRTKLVIGGNLEIHKGNQEWKSLKGDFLKKSNQNAQIGLGRLLSEK